MALIETRTPERVGPSWEEEIDEVLAGARLGSGHWAADPDWQAAADFLVRHCHEALAGREMKEDLTLRRGDAEADQAWIDGAPRAC